MALIQPSPIRRVMLIQLAVLAVFSAVLLVFHWQVAASALMGGAIQILPQAWFTRQAFRYMGARHAQKIVAAMYWGESGKLLLTAILFATVFKLVTWLQPVVLFISFSVMIFVHLFCTAKVLNRGYSNQVLNNAQ